MKLKIIHLVLGKANPERMNGVNKVAYQLVSKQLSLAYDVCLWGIANTLLHNYPPRDFKTKLFQQHKNKLKLDADLVRALQELPKESIVHLHGAFIPEFYLISRHLKRLQIPYVYTPHGSLTEMAMTKNAWVKKFYFSCFESKLIRDAKWVQLLGINEFDYLDELTASANKCLIPNGQDLSDIPSQRVPILRDTPRKPIFGFCGRLASFHKGLDLMLRGFYAYRLQGGKGQLEFIGDGADRAQLEHLCVELELTDAVTFHGKKFGKEKFDLLARMDIFLHTSRMEGFPTAVLEAAAMEKPTITSDATNINSFVDQYRSGYTLNENTPSEIAQSMQVMAKHFYSNTLSIMGKQGRRMVVAEFDWHTIAERLVKTYVQQPK